MNWKREHVGFVRSNSSQPSCLSFPENDKRPTEFIKYHRCLSHRKPIRKARKAKTERVVTRNSASPVQTFTALCLFHFLPHSTSFFKFFSLSDRFQQFFESLKRAGNWTQSNLHFLVSFCSCSFLFCFFSCFALVFLWLSCFLFN